MAVDLKLPAFCTVYQATYEAVIGDGLKIASDRSKDSVSMFVVQ